MGKTAICVRANLHIIQSQTHSLICATLNRNNRSVSDQTILRLIDQHKGQLICDEDADGILDNAAVFAGRYQFQQVFPL